MDDDKPMSSADWLSSLGGSYSKIDDTEPDIDADDDNPLGIWNAGTVDYTTTPPRGWLLGNIFCRGFLSSLVADGGVGKTAARIAQLLSCATGRKLTDEHVHHRCRVLLICFEDGQAELNRRIYAAMLHHNINPGDLDGWFYCAAPKGLKIAEMKEGAPAVGKLEAYLRAAITKHQIDLVSLDPYVKTQSLPENDNNSMDFAMGLFSAIAIDLDCAIDLPHHTNKGTAPTPGDANRGRGAVAMKDAARLCYTLTPMTTDEAQPFGLSELERRSLIRMDSAKLNIAPSAAEAKWLRLVGVPLGNGNDLYPHGDNVQAVEPWYPPQLWADAPPPTLHVILDDIDNAVGLIITPPHRYSAAPRAGARAAWQVITKHLPDKKEQQARAMINAWLKTGLLFEQPYHDGAKGRDITGLHVNPAKRPS
jgi:hypothetical protein